MKKIFLFFILFLFLFHKSDADDPKKTICLNMIVKNESQVITRCLNSVLPLIDYWVIVDTGSTDGTQEVIREFMKAKGVPGELYERPWVNFSHNRNEALQLARGKADYIFLIDADEYLVYENDFKLPKLDKDYYYMTISLGNTKLSKTQLIKNQPSWQFVGVLHEVLTPHISQTYATLEKVVNIYTTEGARSKDPQKFQKDAQILEEALKKEPNNSRYVFYLAQSYNCAKDNQQALKNYEKRAAMGGWPEEVYWSLLQVAKLQELLKMPDEIFIDSYKKAYVYRPSRIEPLYYLANYYRRLDNFEKGYEIAKLGVQQPRPSDILFVEDWIYTYGLSMELSISAYWIGRYEECKNISEEILKKPDLPANIRECVERNLGFANAKLLEKAIDPL